MSDIGIVTEGSLSHFGNIAFANKYRLRRMWLVSPWITAEGSRYDPISLLIEASKFRNCSVHLLTRPPRESWHLKAVQFFRANLKPTVLYSAHLHAKLYILDCDGFRYAMLGSPNLTRRADVENRELAVEFRTSSTNRSDDVSAMIDELISFATFLMSDPDAVLA